MKITDYAYVTLSKALEKEKERLSEEIGEYTKHLQELEDTIQWLNYEYWDRKKESEE